MNRAERRRAGREEKQTVYQLTAKEIAKLKENAEAEALAEIQRRRAKEISQAAKKASAQAFVYMAGIALEIYAESHSFEECNAYVGTLVERYNSIENIAGLPERIEELSGFSLMLDEDEQDE